MRRRALDRCIALGDPWSMIMRAQALSAGSPKTQKQAVDLHFRAIKASQDDGVQSVAARDDQTARTSAKALLKTIR